MVPTKPKWTALGTELLQEIAEENAGDYPTVRTPYAEWNRACVELSGGEGLGPTYYVVLGAATGRGKSTFALNVAAHAIREGHPVGFINFEGSRNTIASRFLTIMSGQQTKYLQPGKMFDRGVMESAIRTTMARSEAGARLYVNEQPIHDLAHLEYGFKQLVDGRGCQLVIVDYLQLVRVTGQPDLFKRTEIASDKLRELTLDLQTRAIAVSQITTESGKKQSQRANPPSEYDLYGGGKWAQDASQVILLDHTSVRRAHDGGVEMKVLLRKNRHGPTGHWWLRHDTSNMRMHPSGRSDGTGSPDPFA